MDSINTNESNGIYILSENQNLNNEENKRKEEQIEDNKDNKIEDNKDKEEDKENDKEDNEEENKNDKKEEDNKENDNLNDKEKKDDKDENNKEDNKKDNKQNNEEDKDENNKDDNNINEIKENILEEKQKDELIENNIKDDNSKKDIKKDIDNKEEEEYNNNINKENIEIPKDEQSEGSQNEVYSHNLLEEIKNYKVQKMPENYTKENANFKILFLGDSGVGKSSLVIRGIKKTFDSSYNPTVGFDLLNYLVKINEKVLKLQIWDTCGQEEFSMCNQSLFKNASMAIMVYSITNKKSYDNIKKWVSRLKTLSKEDTILFLVGNKSDLINQREVDFLEAKNYGKKNFEFFIETSSKNGFNVDILFKKIPIYLFENILEKELNEKEESKLEEYITDDQTSSLLDSINLGIQKKKKKCLKCCC